MKAADLKKRFLMESAVFAGLLVLLAGVALYLDSIAEAYDREAITLQSQAASVTNEMNTLREQFNKVHQNSVQYEEFLKKSANDGLVINRELVRSKFDAYKTRFFLSNVHLSMLAVQDAGASNPANKEKSTSNIQQSEVTVTFDALNDEDVYSLLQAIQSDFSGATRVTKFSIKCANKVTDAALSEITKTGQYSMVQGQLKFIWFGLKPLDAGITSSKNATTNVNGIQKLQ
jgi:hypothetical protein